MSRIEEPFPRHWILIPAGTMHNVPYTYWGMIDLNEETLDQLFTMIFLMPDEPWRIQN